MHVPLGWTHCTPLPPHQCKMRWVPPFPGPRSAPGQVCRGGGGWWWWGWVGSGYAVISAEFDEWLIRPLHFSTLFQYRSDVQTKIYMCASNSTITWFDEKPAKIGTSNHPELTWTSKFESRSPPPLDLAQDRVVMHAGWPENHGVGLWLHLPTILRSFVTVYFLGWRVKWKHDLCCLFWTWWHTVLCSITPLFSRPNDSKSHCAISQEALFQRVWIQHHTQFSEFLWLPKPALLVPVPRNTLLNVDLTWPSTATKWSIHKSFQVHDTEQESVLKATAVRSPLQRQ